MKQCLVKIVLIILTLFTTGCSSSKTIYDTPQKVIGEIMLVGNEPFTKLALRTAGDIVYILRCDEATKHILLLRQGTLAEIVYNEIQTTRERKEINVIGIKILSQSQ